MPATRRPPGPTGPRTGRASRDRLTRGPMPTPRSAPEQTPATKGDRLLPWIAAERAVRAVLLAAVGIVLLTHLHENWARDVTDVTRELRPQPEIELDPADPPRRRQTQCRQGVPVRDRRPRLCRAGGHRGLRPVETATVGRVAHGTGHLAAADPRGVGADEKRHRAQGGRAWSSTWRSWRICSCVCARGRLGPERPLATRRRSAATGPGEPGGGGRTLPPCAPAPPFANQ